MEDKIPDKELIAVARTMNKLYGNYWQIIARSFVGGFFSALGATIGLALFFTVFLSILQSLEILPGIGDFFGDMRSLFEMVTPRR